MKKQSFVSRILIVLLALAMVVPTLSSSVHAAIGDLYANTGGTGLVNNKIDTTDTVSLPIKIYDYNADGMLFEYCNGIGQTYSVPTNYYHDYHATTYLGNEVIYYATNDFYCSLKNAGTDGQYLQLKTPNEYRAVDKVSYFNAVNVSKIRYAVVVMRMPCASYRDEYNASNVYDNRSGLIAFSVDGKEGVASSSGWSGWTTIPKGHVGSNNWFYVIVDLQQAGDISGNISTLYLHTPVRKSSEYIDIATIGYFSDREAAMEYGEYGTTLGSDNGDNRAFSLLYGSRTEAQLEGSSGLKNVSMPTWAKNTYGSASTVYQPNTYFNKTIELNTMSLGYPMFGTFEKDGVATLGLLESSLSEDGLPVYKEETVTFLANLLKTTMAVPERTSTGWLNYTFLRGEKVARYGKDANNNGTIEVSEYRDFAAALREALGVNPATGKGSSLGSYAATKAKHSQLMGTWEACCGNIDTFFDAAYYMLNNIYTHNSYNIPQNQYNYLILSKATVNIDGANKGVYVFDAGFTNSDNASGNISGSSTIKSTVSYNTTNKTISNTAQTAGKTLLEYDTSGNRTTMYPFLPLTSSNNNAGETKSPYYEDDDVNSLLTYGGTYINRNYNYVLQSKGEFLYYADDDLYFEFEGDDDVYLFINGELVLDIGATHGISRETININDYVNWARNVMKSPDNYSAAEVKRAKKLNLQEGGSYSFDFFYMERHGWGANMRIVTNIRVTDTKMVTEKTAYQNDVAVTPVGTIDKTQNVEYGFTIRNDALPGFGHLFYLSFEDNDIGITLSPENGLVIKDGYNGVRVFDKNGGALDVTDIVAYVDGYYDYGFESQTPMDTIVVTFKTNEELIEFLKTMASDHGTDGSPENNGLWEGSTVSFRGMYYKLTDEQISNGVFTNTVHTTANSLATGDGTTLHDEDTVHVFTHNEPKYYHWAGKTLSISLDEMINDIMQSSIWAGVDQSKLPAIGNSTVSIVDKEGNALTNPDVSIVSGSSLWFEVKYPNPGTNIFYVKLVDNTDTSRSIVIPITIYSMAVKDEVVVLDYGLNANLSKDGVIFENDTLHTNDRDTLATIIGYAKDGAYVPGYITEDYADTVNKLAGSYSGSMFTNGRYKLDKAITLNHNEPWVLEWEASGTWSSGTLPLSQTEASNTDGNKYLFLTASGGFVALGTCANNKYNNYGVRIAEMGIDITKSHIYRLVNQTDGTNGNMVYLYVDGIEMGPMTTYVIGGTDVQSAPSNWVSGKDFTFNFIGTSNHPLRNTGIGYIKVWEKGINNSSIRWERGNNDDLVCVTRNNGLVKLSGSSENGTYTNHQYRLDHNVVLQHDQPWTLEWKGVMQSNMLLSSIESNQGTANRANRRYLFVYPGGGMVAFGYHGTYGTDTSNKHRNFGVRGIENMATTNYTYKLVNTVNANGTNTIKLYIDGTFKGDMTTYTIAASGVQTGVNNWLSGKDLVFSYLGALGYQLNGTFEYIEINTGMEDSELTYNFVNDNGVFYDLMNSNTVNRIDFVDQGVDSLTYSDGYYTKSGSDSTITYDDGIYNLSGSLNFKPTAFMDEEYAMWMAISVHEADFTPSALGSKNSDATIDISNEVQMYKKVTVLPATVVYYEDDFPAISYIKTNANTFTAVGDSDNYSQGVDQEENYGHDDFYEGSTETSSAGTLTTITINQSGPIAQFIFNGTGFELISRTDAADAAVMAIEVYQVSSAGTEVKIRNIPVVVEFDQTANGEGGNEIIHQVPVIRVDGLPLSNGTDDYTYRVMIRGIPARDLDAEGAPIVPRNLYIDGLRIFQPMGATNDHYNNGENGATFTELRNEVINGNVAIMKNDNGSFSIGTGTTTWTENRNGTLSNGSTTYTGNVVTSINDYMLLGPNNEVYMDGGDNIKSAIVLYVKETGDVHDLQIALRGIDRSAFYGNSAIGNNAAVMVYTTSGWTTLTAVQSCTEQYYTIDYTKCQKVNDAYQVVIAAESGMVSFSTLKYNGLELVNVSGTPANVMYENGEMKVYENNAWVSATETYPEFHSLSAIMLGDESEPDTDIPANTAMITPISATLSFESEVLVNLYYTAEGIESDDMGLLTWNSEPAAPSIENAETVIPGAQYNVETGKYMVRTNGISAKNLGDDIYLCVYAKQADGTYVYSEVITYSPKTYAMSRLEKSDNEDLKALCVAMLNYGAAAQEYFGYRTDALMNDGLTSEQQALILPYSADLVTNAAIPDERKAGAFVRTEGFTKKSATTSFDSTFTINFYFTAEHEVEDNMTFYYWTAADYAAAETLSAENCTGSIPMIIAENGAYWAAYTGISAKEIDESIYVCGVYEANGETYCTGVIAYSLGNYCQQRAADSSSPMNALAKATVVYGYHANAYFTED